jgi:hypothetical protein
MTLLSINSSKRGLTVAELGNERGLQFVHCVYEMNYRGLHFALLVIARFRWPLESGSSSLHHQSAKLMPPLWSPPRSLGKPPSALAPESAVSTVW